MELAALKREALEQKHLLEHYFKIYAAFQDYVEKLTPYVLGESPNPEMLVASERFRLLFAEHAPAFLEWHDGLQLINEGVATFLGSPDCFENNPAAFRLALSMATTKFEILSMIAARDLRELHEHIAAVEGLKRKRKRHRSSGFSFKETRGFTALDENS
jgi:hypothetical protein